MSPEKKSGSKGQEQIERTYGLSVHPTLSRVIYFLNQLRRSVCRVRRVLREKRRETERKRERDGAAIPGETRGSCRVRKEGEKIGNTNGIGGV